MRWIAWTISIFLWMPSAVAEDPSLQARRDEIHRYLDSRIGMAFPDGEAVSRSGTTGLLSDLNDEGLIVLYAISPCRWAVRAAGILESTDWELNGRQAVVLHPRWRRSYRRWFRKALPKSAPLYVLKDKSQPGWLGDVKVAPVLFLLDPEGKVIDWAIRVPGDLSDESEPPKSRLGSRLE